MKPAVLFDLGNTLAAYYHPEDFRPILRRAIAAVFSELEPLGLSDVCLDEAYELALAENKEAPDFRFTPMVERFERIFRISLVDDSVLSSRLCEVFLAPIFAVGRVYDDTVPSLERLRGRGYQLAVVSNAPWGSPPQPWREELGRLGLARLVDAVVLCSDVGWRKPAREVFEFAASALDRAPEECIFVGDDLRWDISGSEAVGMRSFLIDRDHRNDRYSGPKGKNLDECVEFITTCA